MLHRGFRGLWWAHLQGVNHSCVLPLDPFLGVLRARTAQPNSGDAHNKEINCVTAGVKTH